MKPEKRKIDAMHARFGVTPDKLCKDCNHFQEWLYDKKYFKCEVYGLSRSEASDWRKKYVACGLFNQPWKYGEIMRTLKGTPKAEAVEIPLEGQMDLFEVESND